jgi:hypothetical protein
MTSIFLEKTADGINKHDQQDHTYQLCIVAIGTTVSVELSAVQLSELLTGMCELEDRHTLGSHQYQFTVKA